MNVRASRVAKRKFRPSPESLEGRTLLSGYSPTAIEELFLTELNDARFDPAAYGAALGIDLSNVAPAQPLAMNPLLVEAARLHSQDMLDRGYFNHYTPEGLGPSQRIAATGFPAKKSDESIVVTPNFNLNGVPNDPSLSIEDAANALAALIVDPGVASLGHRIMMLDIGGAHFSQRQVGVGIAFQETPDSLGFLDRTTMMTIDTAATANSNPFLTGVVFDDQSGNGQYEPGEGLSGVTITVANVGSTSTNDAGGYCLQLAPGVHTVTASGGGLPTPITRTVVVGSDNQRLDFDTTPNGLTQTASAGTPFSGLLGSLTGFQPGDTANDFRARIDWGDGHSSSGTVTPNTSGGFDVFGTNTYAFGGTYVTRVLITDPISGAQRAINATIVVSGPSSPGSGSGSGSGNHHPGQHEPGRGPAGHYSPGHPRPHPKPKSQPHHPQGHSSLH